MLAGAGIAISFALRAQGLIGVIHAESGAGVARGAAVALGRVGTNDIVGGMRHAVADTVTMISSAGIAVRIARRAHDWIRIIHAGPGAGIARRATVTRSRVNTDHVVRCVRNACPESITMLAGAQISVIFTRRTQHCIRIIHAEPGARIACGTAVAYGRIGTNNVIGCVRNACPESITMLSGAKVAVFFARGAEDGVRIIDARSRARIAGRAAITGRWGSTDHVVGGVVYTSAESVTMLTGAEVAVVLTWCAKRCVAPRLAEACSSVAVLATAAWRICDFAYDVVDVQAVSEAIALIDRA